MDFSSFDREEPPPLQTMSAPNSPPKRPRLSLQIKAPSTPQVLGKSITALKTDFTDPFSPTAFNTLSNAYAAAIESCSPQTAKPVVNTERPRFLRLQTSSSDPGSEEGFSNPRLQTPGSFTNITPDSPNTAHPSMPPSSTGSSANTAYPFTFTPPQSAHPQEATDPKVFTFASSHLSTNMSPISPNTNALRRRNTIAGLRSAPYTHPRSLRSILRNSPLPPRSSVTPASPRRMSLRYNPNKKVGYNTPLTQTITTNKYVRSHIDLLAEETSPFTPTDPEKESTLETAMMYTGDETRDGGQTPGPYEEMRRRMASLGDETNISNTKKDSLRKRKRREKKRQWIWTIGDNEEEDEEEHQAGGERHRRIDLLSEDSRHTYAPVVSVDSGTCSVPRPPATAAATMLEFPSRESSISDDRDSEMGDSQLFGSPHSV